MILNPGGVSLYNAHMQAEYERQRADRKAQACKCVLEDGKTMPYLLQIGENEIEGALCVTCGKSLDLEPFENALYTAIGVPVQITWVLDPGIPGEVDPVSEGQISPQAGA